MNLLPIHTSTRPERINVTDKNTPVKSKINAINAEIIKQLANEKV
jgi:hypothetical protein